MTDAPSCQRCGDRIHDTAWPPVTWTGGLLHAWTTIVLMMELALVVAVGLVAAAVVDQCAGAVAEVWAVLVGDS